jgi:hypothetical protein
MAAKEYTDKKSSGDDRYGVVVETKPVTFLRTDGNCIEL